MTTYCEECGLRNPAQTMNGLCKNCHNKRQDEAEKRDIIDTSMPNGVVSRWNASPSFLDKKNNYMYFRIPLTQNSYFDPRKIYEIIVKEVAVNG